MLSNVTTVALAALLAAPALAQPPAAEPNLYAKGYVDAASPSEPAINAREAPVTAGLNGQVAAGSAADHAQYEADRADYLAALARHDAAVDRTDARYARQQRAYADAMAVWRVQVADCKRGKRAACDMPPPDVADYYRGGLADGRTSDTRLARPPPTARCHGAAMIRRAALMLSCLAVPAFAAPPPVADLRDEALRHDEVAWDVVEGLTTEIGPRLAATEQEARARTWAVAKLKSLGFANVHVETYQMPVWQRGSEAAEIVAPFPQRLVVAALGNSSPTPPEGLTGEVVGFDGLAELQAASDASVRGKIVFVNHHMAAQQDGGSYGELGTIRRLGPSVAARKGALAIVIRSIGTDHHRIAHTGVQRWAPDVRPIPAAALSVPDAEQLARVLARGKPVTLRLMLGAHMAGTAESGNVVAEVPGRDPKAGVILIGGHLDSWDQGTGAIDDGAGVAITTAAAKRIMAAGRPLRTIRLVWFGAEEPGGFGGKAYAEAHGKERHVLVAESDFGADRVWRYAVTTTDPKGALVERISAALSPLGITRSRLPAFGGTDVEPTAALGAPVIDLGQDGTRYFDIHHTPDDTLDKIDPEQLRQNVAAWTAMLAVAANDPETLTPNPPHPAED